MYASPLTRLLASSLLIAPVLTKKRVNRSRLYWLYIASASLIAAFKDGFELITDSLARKSFSVTSALSKFNLSNPTDSARSKIL